MLRDEILITSTTEKLFHKLEFTINYHKMEAPLSQIDGK